MSWMDDHYRMDNEGNFETLEDYNRAVKSNTEYDSRGDKI